MFQVEEVATCPRRLRGTGGLRSEIWLLRGDQMNLPYAIVLTVVISAVFFWAPYVLTNGFSKGRLSRFIPPALCVLSMLMLWVKATYFRRGYSSLVDVVFIILFASSFVMLSAASLALGRRPR